VGSKRNFPRMAIYPLRKLPALPIAGVESQWLEKLGAELKSGADRAVLCRRTLCEIAYPQYAANWETAVEDAKLPLGILPLGTANDLARTLGLPMDPTAGLSLLHLNPPSGWRAPAGAAGPRRIGASGCQLRRRAPIERRPRPRASACEARPCRLRPSVPSARKDVLRYARYTPRGSSDDRG